MPNYIIVISKKTQKQLKLSSLAGKLSNQTAQAMQQNIIEGRNDWQQRLNKQI